MYAPRYFALRFFAPRYFAAGGGEPAPEGDGCYFADRYFARSYFPGRYFPCTDGETPVVDEVDCVLVCRTQCGYVLLTQTHFGQAAIARSNHNAAIARANRNAGVSR